VRREDKSTEESSGAGRSGFGSGPSGSGRRASSSSSGRRGGGHEDEGIEMQDRSTPVSVSLLSVSQAQSLTAVRPSFLLFFAPLPSFLSCRLLLSLLPSQPLPSPAFPSSADKHLSLRTMLNNAPAPLEYQLPSPPSSNKRTPTKDHLKYRSFQPVDCYEHVQLPAQLSYDLEAQPVLHASMTPPTTAYGDGWAGGGNVHDRTASGSAALLPSRPSYSSHTTSTTSLSDDSDALHPDLSPRRQPKPAPPPASAFLAFLDAGPPSPSHHYPPPPARRKSSPKILTTKLSSPPSNRRPSQPLPSSSSKHAALSSTDRLNDFGLSPSSSPQTSPPSMNSRLPLFSFLSVRGKNPAKSSDALRRPSATSVLSNEGPGGEANRPMESNRSHGTWKKGRGKGGNASVEQLGMYEMSSAVGVGKARTAEQEKQSVAEWKEWARSVAKEESKPPSSASSLYRRNASTPNIHAPSPRSPSVTIPPLPTVPAIFSPPSPHSRHLLRQSSSSIPSAAQLVQEGIISASHLPPSALPPNPLPPPALPDSRKASLAGSSSGARRKSGAAPESLTASAAPSDRGSPAYSLNPLPLPPHRTSSSTLPSLAWTSTSLAPSTQSTAPSTPEPAPPTPLAPPLLSIPSTLTSLPFSSALMARAATYPLPNTMSQSVHQSSSPFTPYRSRLSVPAVQTLLVELLGTLDLFRDAWLLLQQQQKQQQQQSHSRTSSVRLPSHSLIARRLYIISEGSGGRELRDKDQGEEPTWYPNEIGRISNPKEEGEDEPIPIWRSCY
jgi:hypothetical protein